ncbi:MAG: hypothetical protein PVG23_00800 [Nitrosopumilaceae archaeon]|jgi:hypothetical protein
MFSIVVAGVVGILSAPVILPHFFHGYHMAHIALHVGGITLAAFLSVLSIVAFLKLRTKRLLFTAIAFGIFIAAETVLVVDATWPLVYDIYGVSLLEVGHLLTFSTLGVLAMGVFRND